MYKTKSPKQTVPEILIVYSETSAAAATAGATAAAAEATEAAAAEATASAEAAAPMTTVVAPSDFSGTHT